MDYTRYDLIDLADDLYAITGNDLDIYVDTESLERTLPLAFDRAEDEDLQSHLSEKQYNLLVHLYNQAQAIEKRDAEEKMNPAPKTTTHYILEYNDRLKKELNACPELLYKKSTELEETVVELENTQVQRDSFEADVEDLKGVINDKQAELDSILGYLEESGIKDSQLNDELFSLNSRNDDLEHWNDDLQERLNTAKHHFLSLYKKIHHATIETDDANIHSISYMIQSMLEQIFDSTQELIIAKLKNDCPLMGKETEYVIDNFHSIGL